MRRMITLILIVVGLANLASLAEEPTLLGKDVEPVTIEGEVKSDVPPATPESAEAMKYKPLTRDLVRNGSFEEGRWWPYHWEPVDRLCTFWEKGGSQGKRCLRMNTEPEDSQGTKWNARVRAQIEELSKKTKGKPQAVKENPLPEPPKPKKAHPYGTVGGIHGMLYLSDPYKVVPGAIYRITLDARHEKSGDPILFVKGFFKYKGRLRNCGRLQLKMKGTTKEWRRFSVIFHPTRWMNLFGDYPARPEVLRIQLYSYWPPGDYYFDNVKLHIVGFETYKPLRNPNAVDIKKMDEPKEEKPTKSDQELEEGEFPVFD